MIDSCPNSVDRIDVDELRMGIKTQGANTKVKTCGPTALASPRSIR